MTLSLPGLEDHELAALIPHRPVLVAYRGSIAHGTYHAPTEPTGIDDKDIIAVYIPSLASYFGMDGDGGSGRPVVVREWDAVRYEVRHFFALLMKNNPNVLSLLYTPALIEEREGKLILANRDIFLSKKAYTSFCGYAYDQLRRMVQKGESERFKTGNLGAKRKALLEAFGYDCKNAQHAIRLMRMGTEFLRDGKITVDRQEAGDAEELLAIKRGQWTIDEVRELSEDLKAEMDDAYARSPLPEEPDRLRANDLLQDILSLAHATEVAVRMQGRIKGTHHYPVGAHPINA